MVDITEQTDFPEKSGNSLHRRGVRKDSVSLFDGAGTAVPSALLQKTESTGASLG